MSEREKRVDLWHSHDGSASVRVGIIEIRRANDLVITYDFDRDGYVVSMERTIDRGTYMEETGIFDEKAFIPAWNEVEE